MSDNFTQAFSKWVTRLPRCCRFLTKLSIFSWSLEVRGTRVDVHFTILLWVRPERDSPCKHFYLKVTISVTFISNGVHISQVVWVACPMPMCFCVSGGGVAYWCWHGDEHTGPPNTFHILHTVCPTLHLQPVCCLKYKQWKMGELKDESNMFYLRPRCSGVHSSEGSGST